MVLKNSVDSQPDHNYGATLFIKVSILLQQYSSRVNIAAP